MGLLDGKVAVITGAGSGMAKASVRIFVREGAKVVAADISGAEKDTAAEVGGAVLPVHCDVSQEDDVAAMFEAAHSEFGRVDAVLNVAGIGRGGPLADVTMEDYDAVLDVDLRGVLLGTKHGIRAMLQTGDGGSIVNWSSVGGLNASRFTAVYNAAKAGVIAVTKAAAVEYGKKGIRANCICPGNILTEIMGAAGEKHLPGFHDRAALRRAGEPHEVAEVGAFLCSNRASYISGAVIPVDGGWSARIA
jgi:NAD(P)-dependent dehydrogenase (short-subunit alcohol dehydrogenase family)